MYNHEEIEGAFCNENVMEVVLYNSTVCRLCGEENDNGTFLYSTEDNNQNISDLVNAYLPIKVSDDGQLPRTICPGCTIQLEATVEFINLIVTGQKAIRALYLREREYKKTINKDLFHDAVENIIVEVDPENGHNAYQEAHPISLQVAGLDKPKRKRGRPPKQLKPPNEVEQAAAALELEVKMKKRDEEPTGKRRRKTPERFREVVQGKELEKIFKEEGMTDGEGSEDEIKVDVESKSPEDQAPKVPEVIGHTVSGELVVVVKGKGRGRPKGRTRQTHETCAICGKDFSNSGRYMSHIAQHGPVRYQCRQCRDTFPIRLDLNTHQADTGHEGFNVLTCKSNKDVADQSHEDPLQVPSDQLQPPSTEIFISPDIPEDRLLDVSAGSLPDLNPQSGEVNITDEFLKLPDLEADSELKKELIKSEFKQEDLDEHSKKKHKLKCPHCDKKYSSKQSKSMHIKAAHKGERPYICNECGAAFAYPRALALHALAHRRRSNAKGFACDLCGKVLNHPSSVAYHKEAEHANQRYVCNKCGKHFKHKQLLQRHQLVHTQNRPFACKVCNAKFKTKANLINHQMLHTGVKKFSCEECKQRFAHKTSLTLHMRWHRGQKPFVCKVCDKAFTQKGNLSEHMRIHTGEKPFQCTLCPRRFTTSSQHRLHLRRHEPRTNRLTPKQTAPSEDITTIVNNDGSITQITINANNPGNDAVAATVTYAQQSASALGQSVSPQRQVAFAQRQNVKPGCQGGHKCNLCGRVTSTRWALSKHMRLHTGEKPFHCPHCPRTFADASNLNKHKKQIHKQTSLLAVQPFLPTLAKAPSPAAPDQFVVETAGDDERVIYVTYDVEDQPSPYQILEPEQPPECENKVVFNSSEPCALFARDSLLLQTKTQEEPEHMSVTDEQGNPLHFTMQDGTRLAITSLDGHSLQVITQDGQTIPVEINGFTPDGETQPEDVPVDELVITKEESAPSSPVTHYFTIV